MFKVQKKLCSTCIYKPNSTFDLEKLENDVRNKQYKDSFDAYRICHHSDDVCCRGFWNKNKDKFNLGRIAPLLNMVEFVDVDTLK